MGGIVDIPEGPVGPDGVCREIRVLVIVLAVYGMIVLLARLEPKNKEWVPQLAVHLGEIGLNMLQTSC